MERNKNILDQTNPGSELGEGNGRVVSDVTSGHKIQEQYPVTPQGEPEITRQVLLGHDVLSALMHSPPISRPNSASVSQRSSTTHPTHRFG